MIIHYDIYKTDSLNGHFLMFYGHVTTDDQSIKVGDKLDLNGIAGTVVDSEWLAYISHGLAEMKRSKVYRIKMTPKAYQC
jgi:hypothetical protein